MVLVMPVPGLPVPAVKGGAVETGIQQIIDENEKYKLMNIIIISVYDEQAEKLSRKYKHTKFIFIKTTPWRNNVIKIINKIFSLLGLKFRLINNRFFLNEMIKKLNNIDYDAILVKNAVEFILPLSKKTDKKIILQLHNDFLNRDTYKNQKIYETCDLILVNSNYIKQRVLTIKNSKPEKILINKNCTDPKIFNKKLYFNEVNDLKNRYGIKENDLVIMYSGRITPQKGVAELISAVKKIPKDINYKLIIIGSKWFGKNSKNKYFQYLKKISNEISDKIIFTGYIPYNEIPKIHAISDIAVVPSIWEEPAGRVVLEAEASGLPVIVSDAGGISDYINEKSAIVVKRGPKFEDNLFLAIQSLVLNSDMRIEMGKAGHEFAQQFNPETYYRELYEYLNYIILNI